MMSDFYQACYAHPDTGWAVINVSPDMPKELSDDFSLIERTNAGLASGKTIEMGASENPTCMSEIYCRRDAVGLVRTQYGISDGQGRPISFAHGYIFTDAYELLKDPNNILQITRDNFGDMRMTEEEKAEIRSTPGAVNRELINRTAPDMVPEEFVKRDPFTVEGALSVCGLDAEKYKIYMYTILSHLLTSNTEKNLYIKTDGTEEYAWNLMYLTYSAIPYSMRPLISCSTCLRKEQHNTKLIFCYDIPEGVPQIDPVTGTNNVMNETVQKRTMDRNPFMGRLIDFILEGNGSKFHEGMEKILEMMGDKRLNTLQVINIGYSIVGSKDHTNPDKLPGVLYNWLSLPVKNSETWELIVIQFLCNVDDLKVTLGEEVKDLLNKRMQDSVTERFRQCVASYI